MMTRICKYSKNELYKNLRSYIQMSSVYESVCDVCPDTYDLSKTYGKDLLILIDKLGTEQLPNFFALKSWLDTLLAKLPFISERFSDRFLQILALECDLERAIYLVDQ